MAGVLGLFTGMAPFFYLLYRRGQRYKRFEEQLPETMELIGRALRAGHSFTAAIQLTGEEMPDPVGNEFKKVYREISYISNTTQALENLSSRVGCEHLNFFTAAVSLQESTGGNMAELLDNIAFVIRERLKLQKRIQSLSAEGRFSAVVLIALPVMLALFLYTFTKHLDPLLNDPAGRKMLAVALVLMGAGIIAIRKMTKIKL
jgi:tight adherence protein B